MSKRYKVVGNHPVDGHAPGKTFTADYDEAKEAFLVAAGHIKPLRKEKQDGEADR